MPHVRSMQEVDVAAVVARVKTQLARASRDEPFINDAFDEVDFDAALRAQRAHAWVALRGEQVVGHLYGAVLDDARGRSAWIGPDGVSFDDLEVLAALYAQAGRSWFDAGAHEHWVWVPDQVDTFLAWSELGFAKEHRRGVRALFHHTPLALPEGVTLRRGGAEDLDVANELDAALDEAQREGPNFFFADALPGEGLTETLSDPEVSLRLLTLGSEVVGQCLTYPLASRRGSFDDVVHLSGVVIREEWRERGWGHAMVDHVLEELRLEGARYVEVHWRVANHGADRFWRSLHFRPTFTRLRRVLDA